MKLLTFTPENHQYRVDGVIVPSVTQVLSILNDYSQVDEKTLLASMDFGKKVHRAIELLNNDDLDEESLDDAIKPYLEHWEKFCTDFKMTEPTSEHRMYHPTLNYAGTIDIYCFLDGVLSIIDIKTGAVSKSAAPQVAAYKAMYEAFIGHKVEQTFILQLNEDRYNVINTTKSNRHDMNIFLSCLNIYNYKNGGK